MAGGCLGNRVRRSRSPGNLVGFINVTAREFRYSYHVTSKLIAGAAYLHWLFQIGSPHWSFQLLRHKSTPDQYMYGYRHTAYLPPLCNKQCLALHGKCLFCRRHDYYS